MSYSDQHYGAGVPGCEICGGIGYWQYDVPHDHPEFGKVHDCKCRQIDPARGGLARTWMNEDQIAEALRFHADFRFGKPGREAQEGAALSLLEDIKAGRGGLLTLVSEPGTGKTCLLYYVAVECVMAGLAIRYCDAERFTTLIAPDRGEENWRDTELEILRTATVILLDNLDWDRAKVAAGESWAAEQFVKLIDRRYQARANKATICAFNTRFWKSQQSDLIRSARSRLRAGTIAIDDTSDFRAAMGRVVGATHVSHVHPERERQVYGQNEDNR